MALDLPELQLDKMVGPLPAGAWIAVIGLGVGAAYLINRRTAAGIEVAPIDPGQGAGPLADYGDPLAGFTPTGVDAQTPISSPSTRPVTNSEWVSYAGDMLRLHRRPFDAYSIQQALQKYINARTLSPSERTIVDEALRLAGYPPESPGIVDTPEPAPEPGSTGSPGYERTPPNLVPPGVLGTRRTRVGKIGSRTENTTDIARRVYGSHRYGNELRFLNPSLITSNDHARPLPLGAQVAY